MILCLFLTSKLEAQKNKEKNKVDPIKDYKEDFSSYRPTYKEEEKKDNTPQQTSPSLIPKNHINEFLEEKLDSIHLYNEKITTAEGFRILIYTGPKREDARIYSNNVYQILPNEKTYIDWKQPNFKVKVGNYIDKLEAYYAYARLINSFPNAIVIPDKIYILRDIK
jgi:hypothetical protein